MSRTRPWAAGLAVAVVAVLATATPASAHDKLVSSDPSAEQELKEAPSTVSLTFSADVLDMGAAIVVADAAGTDWVSAAPTIDGPTVTAVLDEGMPESGYEIRWRVVSSDGHPISGIVPFSVGDADSAPSAEDTEPTGNTEEPAAASTPDTGGDATSDTSSTQVQTAQEDEGPGRAALVGAGGAAVAVALLALVQFLRRRISAPGTDGTGTKPGPSGTK